MNEIFQIISSRVSGITRLRSSQNKIAQALMETAGTAITIVKGDYTMPESTISTSFSKDEPWQVRRLVLEPIATSGIIGDRLWATMETMGDLGDLTLLWQQVSFFADNPKVVAQITKKFSENAKAKYSAIADDLKGAFFFFSGILTCGRFERCFLFFLGYLNMDM